MARILIVDDERNTVGLLALAVAQLGHEPIEAYSGPQAIQLIADSDALQEIQRGLRDVWYDQPHLEKESEELEALIQFTKIRSMMLQDENTKN